MTYEEWIKKYKPISNGFTIDAPYDNTMFETTGDEQDFVRMQNPNNVWTLCEEDGTTFIQAGWQLVNRLGYFVTENLS